jgi:hypothetical protein
MPSPAPLVTAEENIARDVSVLFQPHESTAADLFNRTHGTATDPLRVVGRGRPCCVTRRSPNSHQQSVPGYEQCQILAVAKNTLSFTLASGWVLCGMWYPHHRLVHGKS